MNPVMEPTFFFSDTGILAMTSVLVATVMNCSYVVRVMIYERNTYEV